MLRKLISWAYTPPPDGWINVYVDGDYCYSELYATRIEADQAVEKAHIYNGIVRIACVPYHRWQGVGR